MASAGAIDVPAVMAAWDSAFRALYVGWPGFWIHADVLRPNLLPVGGCLRAVIDFGSVGVGDPATDNSSAWAVCGAAGRAAFHGALGVDNGTWRRVCGIALTGRCRAHPGLRCLESRPRCPGPAHGRANHRRFQHGLGGRQYHRLWGIACEDPVALTE